jgi:hypothetical protein
VGPEDGFDAIYEMFIECVAVSVGTLVESGYRGWGGDE